MNKKFSGEQRESARQHNLAAICAFAAIAFLLMPQIAMADLGVFSCITDGPVDCVVEFITSAIANFFEFLFSIMAWLVQIGLALGNNIVNATAVQVGFGISLAIANLGFVLGIIVIAIMTILRRTNYGIKQNLIKLILAAILVNFSLVIAGVILNFATGLSNYFLAAAKGNTAGGFTENIASAFQIQTYTTPSGGATPENPFAASLSQILGMLFTILMLGLMVLTMGALAVLLLIRYIALGILLILMPFVWVAWVFQYTKNLWTTWWRTFLKWSFFAPISLFFIFLAISTWSQSGAVNAAINQARTASGTLASHISESAKFLNNNLATVVGQQIIIIGLMLGSLFAANKLSIMGAGAAYGAAQGMVKGYGKWVRGLPGRAGRAAARVATREKPSAPVIPRYESPRGIFQKLVNAASRGEEKVRGATYAAGRPLRGVAGVAIGGEAAEPKAAPVAPPAPEKLSRVEEASIERVGRALGKTEAEIEAEKQRRIAQKTPEAKPVPVGGAPAPTAAAGATAKTGEKAAEKAGAAAGAAAAEKIEEEEAGPEAVIRRGGAGASEQKRVAVDDRTLRKMLQDYGAGGKFWGEGNEWKPLIKALTGPGTLLGEMYRGAKKGSGLFKEHQEKKDLEELGQKIADELYKRTGDRAGSDKAAKEAVEVIRQGKKEMRKVIADQEKAAKAATREAEARKSAAEAETARAQADREERKEEKKT